MLFKDLTELTVNFFHKLNVTSDGLGSVNVAF